MHLLKCTDTYGQTDVATVKNKVVHITVGFGSIYQIYQNY